MDPQRLPFSINSLSLSPGGATATTSSSSSLPPPISSSSSSSSSLWSGKKSFAASAAVKLLLHPTALFNIYDHFGRRPTPDQRVIGTLLGINRGNNTIEITQAFAVPHLEKANDVSVGKDYNKAMRALLAKSHPNEVVVGWYATTMFEADEFGDMKSCMVHDYYASECANPVHLVVDVTKPGVNVKAFHIVGLSLSPSSKLFFEFRPLALEMSISESERFALQLMATNEARKAAGPPTALAKKSAITPAGLSPARNLEDAMETLMSDLDDLVKYADDVVAGRAQPDPAMGRRLADLISSVPHVSVEGFTQAFNNSVQDLLMVSYLANLAKAQVSISEKLARVI